jgi:hypothetical protein
MTPKNYSLLAGLIFGVVALLQFARVGLPIIIDAQFPSQYGQAGLPAA